MKYEGITLDEGEFFEIPFDGPKPSEIVPTLFDEEQIFEMLSLLLRPPEKGVWGDPRFRETTKRGGPDSGYHAPHKGRPGQVGGSAPRNGLPRGLIPEGFDPSTVATVAAFILIHHTAEDEAPPRTDELLEVIVLGDRTLGEWATEVLAEIRPRELIESAREAGVNLIDEDMRWLQAIDDKGIWVIDREVVVVNQLPEADRTSLEAEWGISPYALIPVGLRPTGTWDIVPTAAPGGGKWVITISKESPDMRRTFWHEFAHTVPGHVLVSFIGDPEPNELTGHYIERFVDHVAESGQERGGPGSGHHGHKGRPGQVGGSLPRNGDGNVGVRIGEPRHKFDLSRFWQDQETVTVFHGIDTGRLEAIREKGLIVSASGYTEGKTFFATSPLLAWRYSAMGGEVAAKGYARLPRERRGILVLQVPPKALTATSHFLKKREHFEKAQQAVKNDPGFERDLLTGGEFYTTQAIPFEFIVDVFRYPEGKQDGALRAFLKTAVVLKLMERLGFSPKTQERGGEGSGHHGHKGRPGQVGGSLPSGEEASMFDGFPPAVLGGTLWGITECHQFGLDTGRESAVIIRRNGERHVYRFEDTELDFFKGDKDLVLIPGLEKIDDEFVAVHNHPTFSAPSPGDVVFLFNHDVTHIFVINHDGILYRISRTPDTLRPVSVNAVEDIWRAGYDEIRGKFITPVAAGELSRGEAHRKCTEAGIEAVAKHYRLDYRRESL